MIRLKFKIRGRVQGVYFRASTEKVCLDKGISGFVRNESDGSVYLEAEGSKQALNELRAWVAKGPVLARVDEVIEEEIPPIGGSGFELRRE